MVKNLVWCNLFDAPKSAVGSVGTDIHVWAPHYGVSFSLVSAALEINRGCLDIRMSRKTCPDLQITLVIWFDDCGFHRRARLYGPVGLSILYVVAILWSKSLAAC